MKKTFFNKENNFSNLIIFLITICFLLCITSSIYAEPIIIKMAHAEPEVDYLTTPYKALTSVFKSIVETDSNGEIKVEVYPSRQLGDNTSIIQQCEQGLIETTPSQNTGMFASYYPEIQILDIPYLFQNVEIARKVLNGWFGKYMEEELLKRSGLRIMAWLPNGLKHISNSKREIRSLEDLKGLKIRCQSIPIYIKFIEALGASAIPIPWAELYVALQTGVVDGQFNPPYTTTMQNLQEVQKYYTLDANCLNVMAPVINDDFFQSLSIEHQKIIKHAYSQASIAFLGMVATTRGDHLEMIKNAGVKITALTEKAREEFINIARPASIKYFEEEIAESDILQKLLKAIDEVAKEI